MKRTALIVIAAALLFTGTAHAAEKYESMPEIFEISVDSTDYRIGDNEAYIYKEYLKTTNQTVNEELRAIADAYDEQLAPTLQMDPSKNAKRNSRLDIKTVYYRTGEFYVSTMTLATVTFDRVQLAAELQTRTYDLKTGDRLMLSDLFATDSPAWEILQNGVRETLSDIYPGEARDEGAIAMYCTREAIEHADFTLSGMELTLHYPAGMLFDGKTNVIHVRFFYPQFDGMMTGTGVAATDNSRWKMIAITCDDGPELTTSVLSLNNFRQAGARVTYFIQGEMLEAHSYIFINQIDQNHIFGNHTYNHWSGYSIKTMEKRLYQLDRTDELTLFYVGEKARYFRAPGGTYPPWVEAVMPVPIIQWSLDTYDYTGKKPSRIEYTIRKSVKEFDIILCHDTGDYLNKAIPLFGEWLTEHGYMMVTLDELAAVQNVTPEPNVVYWSFRPGENSIDGSNLDFD